MLRERAREREGEEGERVTGMERNGGNERERVGGSEGGRERGQYLLFLLKKFFYIDFTYF